MVGIAGKSKACLDCKRRRVKCDFKLPLCLRCAKAGIACQGYQRATLWVNRTPDHPGVTALSVMTGPRLRQDQQNSSSSEWLQDFHQLRSQLSQPIYSILHFRSQIHHILKSIYLPQPPVNGKEDDSDPSPSSWLKAVCQMTGPSKALDHSLLAFGAIQVWLSGESGISRDETVQLYNDALGKVIRDLDTRQTRNSDQILAAIVVLSTCELFVFTTDRSWSAHAHGISELLRRRGLPEQATASWTSLCLRLCVICVIQALAQRCSLSLDPDRWRHLIGHSAPPESWGRFLAIVADVPSILQKAHSLLSHSESNMLTTGSHYSTLLVQKYQKLDSWRRLRQRTTVFEGPLYWSVPSKLDNPADEGYADKLFPFALMFSSMGSAIAWVFCSTVMLHILDAALRLDEWDTTAPSCSISKSPSPRALNPSLETLYENALGDNASSPTQADADMLARMLCQSIEFCYRTENGTFGPQSTCSTQWALRRYFGGRGLVRELEWCRAIKDIKRPGSKCGIDLMQFGPSMTEEALGSFKAWKNV